MELHICLPFLTNERKIRINTAKTIKKKSTKRFSCPDEYYLSLNPIIPSSFLIRYSPFVPLSTFCAKAQLFSTSPK